MKSSIVEDITNLVINIVGAIISGISGAWGAVLEGIGISPTNIIGMILVWALTIGTCAGLIWIVTLF